MYGDKELKIATVNKIKQKLRNAILQDPMVAPALLKLAINDALGFEEGNLKGGPDGSIQFEMNREENISLESAFQVIVNIKKELQRTNVVGFGDLCAFAGAEGELFCHNMWLHADGDMIPLAALETVGAPRMVVQVGRFDAKSENTEKTGLNWDSPTVAGITTAFGGAGLGPRDIVLLLGGLGEVSRITKESLAATSNESDEDNDEFEPTPFVPTTFGSRDAMYGAKMGKGDFGSKYFQNLIKGKFDPSDKIGPCLAGDEKLREYIKKYAGSETALKLDIVEAYSRLNLLGQAYTTRNS